MLWSPVSFANRRWSSQYNPTSDVTKKKKQKEKKERSIITGHGIITSLPISPFSFSAAYNTAPFSLVIFLFFFDDQLWFLSALSPSPLKCRSGIILGGERSGSRKIDRITAQQKRHGPSQEGNKRAKGGISVCVYDKRRTLPSFFKERSKERKISFSLYHPILLFRFSFFF
jgi:hypothetical protein